MEYEIHREPVYEEVGEQICISPNVMRNAMRSSARVMSLESPVAGTENLTFIDVIEDEGAEDPVQQLINKSLATEIENAISTLPALEASVLRLYFGLNDIRPQTFEEIGDQFGLISKQVRQLKENAIFSLKNSSRYKHLKEHLC
jgi:RNA polymerase primary sigma factor